MTLPERTHDEMPRNDSGIERSSAWSECERPRADFPAEGVSDEA